MEITEYTIEKKVKEFCLEQLKHCHKGDTNVRAIAFGALMFANNNLLPAYNEELGKWWNDIIWYEFEKKIRGEE